MTTLPTTRARQWAGGLALGFLLGLLGCKSVLEVDRPDIVLEAGSAAGALALHNGVILRFNQAMDGSGDAPDGFFLLGGLLADEWRSGDTFEQRNTIDFRVVQASNSFLATIFRSANRVRNEGQSAINGLRQYSPVPASNIGQMFAFMAFAEIQISEFFCNGTPFSELNGNQIVYGDPVTNDSGFARAANHADSALANVAGPDSVRIKSFAQLMKARALLDRNQPAAAAVLAALVPTSFQYLSTHSINATDNVMWLQNISLRRYVMGDNEGTNGLPFKSASDPRIPAGPTAPPLAFDGNSPWVSQGIWLNRTDPVIIASGIEARLIEAEAALRTGDVATYLAKLNAARATRTDLPALIDPGTPTAEQDLLFRERAFWLFSTGHRLGDLRRLMRQYGRTQAAIFPTGVWFKGGPYGIDVNFPIPQAETNNPKDLTGACIDRNP